MKAIKKLKIIWRVAILSILIPFFLFQFKNNIKWGIAFAVLLIIFIFYRRIFLKNKNVSSKDYYENYTNVSFYYFYGAIFLIFAVMFSLYTLLDLIKGGSIPSWAIIILLGSWIFGILLTYYTYQAGKEFHSISKSKKKPKRKIEKEGIRKFNINYIMAFVILATIISFAFKLMPLTPTYILINILGLILIYLFLRIVLSKRKIKK